MAVTARFERSRGGSRIIARYVTDPESLCGGRRLDVEINLVDGLMPGQRTKTDVGM